MSFDLTNKNIQDTFQNLLQKTGSDGRLHDLVGNEVRDLTIDGTLTVNSFITSESIVNTSSGSTAFGNSSDDTHKFIGNITASGNISASGTMIVKQINIGNSGQEGRIFYNAVPLGHPLNYAFLDGGIATTSHITASGNISASGTITMLTASIGGGIFTSASLAAGGGGGSTNAAGSDTQVQFNDGGTNFGGDSGLVFNKTTNTLTVGVITSSGGMTVGGNISASGTIVGSNLSGTNTGDQDLSSLAVKTEVSGAFTADSASFSTRISASEVIISKTLVSSSNQLTSSFLEITGDNVISSSTQISASDATFIATSQSLASKVGQALNTDSNVEFNSITAGTITTVNITSSFITSSTIQTSGSNVFGDELSDTQTFIGNITASGDISASGGIFGNTINVNAGNLDGTIFGGLAGDFFSLNKHLNGVLSITASGDISSSGTIIGSNLSGTNTGDQDLSGLALKTAVSGAFTADSASFSTRISASEVITSKTLISSSNQLTNSFLEITGDNVLSSSNQLTSSFLEISGDNVLSSSTQISASDATFIATSQSLASKVGQALNTDSNVQFNHITASGNISASGTIFGQFERVDTSEDASNSVVFGNNSDSVLNVTNGFAFNPSNDKLTLGGTVNIFGQDGAITGLTSLTSTNITASGNISSSGTITANAININGSSVLTSSPFTAAGISGSFVAASSSFSTRVSASEVVTAKTLVSSSTQIDNLGFLKVSGDNVLSSSNQLTSSFLEITGDNVLSSSTQISASDATFIATSQSLASKVGQAVNTDSDVTFNSLTANTITTVNITSSFITSSTIQTSGSNVFGDDSTDTQTFIGNITASNNISASGTIIGSNLSGTNTGDQSLVHLAVTGSDVTFNHITASGNISASATGSFGRLENVGTISTDKVAADLNQNTFLSLGSAAIVGEVNGNDAFEFGENSATFEQDTVTFDGHITASGGISSSAGLSEFDRILTSRLKFRRPSGVASIESLRDHPSRSGSGDVEFIIPGDISASGDLFGVSASLSGPGEFSSVSVNSTAIVYEESGRQIFGHPSKANRYFATDHQFFSASIELATINSTGISGSATSTLTVGGDITTNEDVIVGDGKHVGGSSHKWTFDNSNSIIKSFAATTKIALSGIDEIANTEAVLIEKSDNSTSKPFLLIVNDHASADRAYLSTKVGDKQWSFGAQDNDSFRIASGSNMGNIAGANTVFHLLSDNVGGAKLGLNTSTTTPPSTLTIGGDLFVGSGSSNGHITASGNIDVSGDIFNTTAVQMTNSSSVVNTFSTSSHKTCKYLLQVTSGSHIQSSEMLVMLSASAVHNTEYAQINTINLVDFSSTVSASNVQLIASSSFISCSVKFIRTLI
jgi:hypothetical protein